MPTTERELKETFRLVFPEYAKSLDSCTSQEKIKEIHQEMIAESKRDLEESLNKIGYENVTEDLEALIPPSEQSAPIALNKQLYNKLIAADGDDIKQEVLALINGLQMLKGMKKDDPGLVAAQILLSGGLGIGGISCTTVAQKLYGGFLEGAAALAGVEAETVEAVCGLVTAVIVIIIIPIIYFMEKPANCICLLINELDVPLTFVSDYNVHGKRALVPLKIREAVNLGGGYIYPVAGLIACEKKDSALIGSEYGIVMKYKDEYLAFGMESPLTTMYVYNNCYCEFTSDAQAVANATDEKDKLSWEASKGNLRLSIKCSSTSGSIAYFVARAYKV